MPKGNYMHLPGGRSDATQTLRGRAASFETERHYYKSKPQPNNPAEQQDDDDIVRKTHEKLGFHHVPFYPFEN
jgi:hypothetical protein